MISALSLGNASKYEFLAGKDILPETDMLEKGAGIKRLECFLLGKELKAQSDITKKQHQWLAKAFIYNKDIKHLNESLIIKEKI